ncbi:unnamed protein product [Microthlaspi erraticum]|uniref:Serine-rich protein-like protein n=1 Tax=Microthlaspi erraticum TaxID=1685480 RepID=A0A6D2LFN4_9BRAS|nr:unnamed protein product [Microthlaspi erraticum]
MAASGRSSGSSAVLRPLSSSQRLHNHQRSASPCNLNLRLKRFSHAGNVPKPSAAVSNQKIKCLCSPTTHPGSFRCAFHRRLENEKKGNLGSPARRNSSGNAAKNSGLVLRKVALVNSLRRIACVEAERFRRSLAATMLKPSSLHINRRTEFRPRPSRFKSLDEDQD